MLVISIRFSICNSFITVVNRYPLQEDQTRSSEPNFHEKYQKYNLDNFCFQKHSRKIRSRSSSIHSVSIESALEAFDFLKNEDSLDDFENPNNK